MIRVIFRVLEDNKPLSALFLSIGGAIGTQMDFAVWIDIAAAMLAIISGSVAAWKFYQGGKVAKLQQQQMLIEIRRLQAEEAERLKRLKNGTEWD